MSSYPPAALYEHLKDAFSPTGVRVSYGRPPDDDQRADRRLVRVWRSTSDKWGDAKATPEGTIPADDALIPGMLGVRVSCESYSTEVGAERQHHEADVYGVAKQTMAEIYSWAEDACEWSFVRAGMRPERQNHDEAGAWYDFEISVEDWIYTSDSTAHVPPIPRDDTPIGVIINYGDAEDVC